MKRKATLTAVIVFALVGSLAAGLQAVEVAEANPYGMLLTVWKDKIAVDSPQNTTSYSAETITVNFTIKYLENETAARYTLNNELVYVKPNNVTTKTGEGYTYTPSTNQNTTFTMTWYVGHYSFPLQNLTEGTYNLTIQRLRCSASIFFTIDRTPPAVTGLSVESKTYNSSTIPLNFTINEPASWLGYRLDDQNYTTVKENTTLTGLSEGSHYLAVCANDTAGNIGKSDTIFFTVNTATPSPAPTSAPIQQPTQEPTLTARPPPDVFVKSAGSIFSTVIGITVVVAAIVAVVAGLMVYVKRRK